jgi:predicted NUDIX family NTP pyrophosphohydrolase
MTKSGKVSAGLLLFRTGQRPEFFLAHPGGPFWRHRDEGAWTIPKGVIDVEEAPIDAAIREFREETGIQPMGPFIALGSVRQKGGKVIEAWAWEGDADPEGLESNLTRVEWPRGSGQWMEYPEIDRCGWFGAEDARRKLNPAQAAFIDRILEHLSARSDGDGGSNETEG